MAKEKKKTRLKRPLTKRQASKWQRQQRIQRIIVGIGAFFFAFIVGLIGYGYYVYQVKPFSQPAVRVNDTVFDMGYYVEMLAFYSQEQEPRVVSATADMVVEIISTGELIRQGAANVGVSASTEEISGELKSLELPDGKLYRDMATAKLLADKLLKEYFDPKVPTACEQVKVQAMFLESKESAEEARDRLKAGDAFASLAKEFSREAVTKAKDGELGWLPKGFVGALWEDLGDSLLEDIAFSLEPGTLSEPTYDESVTKGIGYWILEVIEKDVKKGRHVRGILLGSWKEAAEVKAKLEAGEDFGALAQEYSQHVESKELKGDLGWTQGGIANRVVMGFVEQLEPGVLSKPVPDESVETRGGYWLVKVEDKDTNRQVEGTIREKLKSALFQNWVMELQEKSVIENYLSEQQKSWAVARVLEARGQ